MHNIQHLNNHYGKIEGFVIGLAIDFSIVIDICNSWSLYNTNAIGHIATITSNTPKVVYDTLYY
jgi:hypothetical protein